MKAILLAFFFFSPEAGNPLNGAAKALELECQQHLLFSIERGKMFVSSLLVSCRLVGDFCLDSSSSNSNSQQQQHHTGSHPPPQYHHHHHQHQQEQHQQQHHHQTLLPSPPPPPPAGTNEAENTTGITGEKFDHFIAIFSGNFNFDVADIYLHSFYGNCLNCRIPHFFRRDFSAAATRKGVRS